MAFKANTATQAQGLMQAVQQAAWVKMQAQNGITMLTGTVTAEQVLQLLDNLRAPLAIFGQVAAIPGIGAYAQGQFNDNTYNVATEFSAMVAAVQAAITWVVTNFPKGPGGFLQAHTINANGSRTSATFTPAQTAGLSAALATIVSVIS